MTESGSDVAWGWQEDERIGKEELLRGMRKLLGMMYTFIILIVKISQIYTYVKVNQIIQF